MKWLISRVNMVSTSTPARIASFSKAGERRRNANVAQRVSPAQKMIKSAYQSVDAPQSEVSSGNQAGIKRESNGGMPCMFDVGRLQVRNVQPSASHTG
jgi:hypothetical protein